AAYDVVRYVENLPDAPPDDRQLPDLDFSFYHEVCVFDHVSKTIWLITLADCRGLSQASSDSEIDAVQRSAEERLQSMFVKLTAAGDSPSSASAETARLKTAMPEASLEIATTEQELPELDVESNFTRESFHQAVDQCVEYIRAGDIFQVVPSQRLSVQSDVPPLEVYRSLRVVNPSPFMFFLRASNCTLIGCSPEIMCRVHEGEVTVRPLAGTRPRGKDDDHDKELEKELLADPKERAEHVMLVDLGRNDVGRVAQFGTVSLPEVMVVERYSHVMHISSEVRGRLREGLDAFDALGSALPAGTVSGAPKVRAMQVIDSLEPHRRGPYGGAVGYIDYRGNMDTCIALRTMVYTNGRYDVQAGCGVVADSQPEAEYQETLNKAQAMIAAIRAAAARTRS
ncbi:MAG: chorismate-binding protein, partial [Planctomycetota bacterium]